MRRQGASQRSLEEYMSGYDTQVARIFLHKECKYGKDCLFIQSDAEFFGDARPITSNLPNAAQLW